MWGKVKSWKVVVLSYWDPQTSLRTPSQTPRIPLSPRYSPTLSFRLPSGIPLLLGPSDSLLYTFTNSTNGSLSQVFLHPILPASKGYSSPIGTLTLPCVYPHKLLSRHPPNMTKPSKTVTWKLHLCGMFSSHTESPGSIPRRSGKIWAAFPIPHAPVHPAVNGYQVLIGGCVPSPGLCSLLL